jgi:hypothetical protein
MSQRAYLDSQCLAYTFGQPLYTGWTRAGTERLRAAIADAFRDDRIVICGSQFHLEEASRIPDEGARRRFITGFWDLVKWNLLLPTYDLVKLEAKLGRPLEANEPYEEFHYRQRVRRGLRDQTNVGGIASAVLQHVDRSRTSTEARRTRALQTLQARYANRTPAEVTRAWWQEADAQIEDWMNDYIGSSKEHLGLSDDASTWPKPRDLQTAWAIHAYQMARIVMNVGLQERIGDGDAHDAHHFASAWYTDVFVTEDQALRRTINIIPNTPITVLSLNEFATQLGVPPS